MNDPPKQTIDQKIREALDREDAELQEQFCIEPPLHELLIEGFRGRTRWFNALAFLFSVAGLAMAIVAGYQFFYAESTWAMIAWATCFLLFALWVAMLKFWFWLEIQKYAITREVKRLELQVAHLAHQLGSRS